MNVSPPCAFLLLCLAVSRPTSAQPPADSPPPPLWDAQVGASFVGTSGNSDTASTGADFTAHRRGLIWQIDAAASVLRTSNQDVTTGERYFGMARLRRALTPMVGLSSGVKLERDPFSGLDARSITDAGLSWALVHQPRWTLDGVTSAAWLHESRTSGADVNDPVGVLQLLSRIPWSSTGETTQRVTYYPDFKITPAYRTEAEITAQAAMSPRLALKIGYLFRYSNDPVLGFKRTDTTTTASVVWRWKAAAPPP